MGQCEDEGLNLGLGGVKVGVAARDLPSGFGGFVPRLINEFLNGANNPFREFRSGIKAGQFSVQIHARIVAGNRPPGPMNRSFQR